MVDISVSEARVIIQYDIHEPIEVTDFTKALSAFSYEYIRYIEHLYPKRKYSEDVKLYITKIESNCILTELAPYVPFFAAGAMATLENTNAIADFIINFKSAMNYLSSLGRKKNVNRDEVIFNKPTLNSFEDITKIVANSNNGEMNITLNETILNKDGSQKIIEFKCSNKQAKEAYLGIQKSLTALENKTDAQYKNMVVRLYAASQEVVKTEGKTDHKGIVEEIYSEPVKLLFASDMDKAKFERYKMGRGNNILTTSLIVDLNVTHNAKGKPVIYRILNLHEILPDEEE